MKKIDHQRGILVRLKMQADIGYKREKRRILSGDSVEQALRTKGIIQKVSLMDNAIDSFHKVIGILDDYAYILMKSPDQRNYVRDLFTIQGHQIQGRRVTTAFMKGIDEAICYLKLTRLFPRRCRKRVRRA